MTDDKSVPEKLGTEPTCLRRCPPSTSGERLREVGLGAVSLFVTVMSSSQDAHVRLHRLGAFLSLTGLAQVDACSSLRGGGRGGRGERLGDSPLGLMRGLRATVYFLSPSAAPTPVCKREKCCFCTPDPWVLLLSSL